MTATVTGATKSPPITGTFQFFGGSLSLPNPASVTQGTDANGNQTLTATLTITPQNSENVAANYMGDANYAPSIANVFITVNIPDFSVNVPASPLLMLAGQPGTLPFSVSPAGALASVVTLSCGGSLPGYSCGVSPGSVSLNNGANANASLTLTPNLSAAKAISVPIAKFKRFGYYPSGFRIISTVTIFACLAAFLVLGWPTRRLRWRLTNSLTIMCGIGLVLGCSTGSVGGGGGGGGGGGPYQTSTTVVTSAAKVAAQMPVTFTATVTGSGNPTGSVAFYLSGSYYGTANLAGNTASLTTQVAFPGIFVLTAQYQGNGPNNASTSPGVNEAITGSTVMSITGQTSTLAHIANVTVTLQ